MAPAELGIGRRHNLLAIRTCTMTPCMKCGHTPLHSTAIKPPSRRVVHSLFQEFGREPPICTRHTTVGACQGLTPIIETMMSARTFGLCNWMATPMSQPTSLSPLIFPDHRFIKAKMRTSIFCAAPRYTRIGGMTK